MANNKILSRGARLLAMPNQDDNFSIYQDLTKTSDSRLAKGFDRVVSSGTVSADNTGSPWLKVFGYKSDRREATGYVLLDDNGTIWQDQPIEAKPAPGVPESIKIVYGSAGKAVLSWEPIADAAVEIESASIVQGPFSLIAISRVGGSSYDINNLAQGILSYFRLRSTNDFGESQYSNIVTATAIDGNDKSPDTTGTTVTSPALPDAPPYVAPPSIDNAPDIYASPIQDDKIETSTSSSEEPIITWMKGNIGLVLTIGGAVIISLMMLIVARRS